MKAILGLEDGTIFEGESIGASGRTFGEVVFNTSMTGYQEILSDPSYSGQIVTMTYPIIGNYGFNSIDFESKKVQAAGFVVKQLCDAPSNFRSEGNLNDFLAQHKVVGIQGIDTRALTRHLRVRGVMMGAISTDETPEELIQRIKTSPSYAGVDFVKKVTTPEAYEWPMPAGKTAKYRVALLDCGVKFNIMRILSGMDCQVTVFPCDTSAEKLMDFNPDGIVFSPGPGDPALLDYIIANIRKLLEKKPLFGICLGNQLLGTALGGKTYKLKFGHRGANHPVKDLDNNRVYITSQNHGYAVDAESLNGTGAVVSHLNLNDNTVEGLRHSQLPIFSIQYHPEASPGPHDSRYLFDKFIHNMEQFN